MAKTTSTRTTSRTAARKPAAAGSTKTAAKSASKPAPKPAAKTAKPVKTAKPAAAKPAAAPDPVSGPVPGKAADEVRVLGKRELVDRVVTASGIKKRAAKPVIEAMLKELGDALSRGETLNLQPFGKGIVKTRKNLENAEVVELRLRRSRLAMDAAENAALPPLAEAAE